jgi:hypothetical protein
LIILSSLAVVAVVQLLHQTAVAVVVVLAVCEAQSRQQAVAVV